jgi:hypothetical protein
MKSYKQTLGVGRISGSYLVLQLSAFNGIPVVTFFFVIKYFNSWRNLIFKEDMDHI